MSSKKNPFLARQEAKIDEAVRIGVNIGLQLSSDCYQMALNDSAVMSRDVLGAKRLEKVADAAEANVHFFLAAVDYRDPEADVLQEKMDSRLRKIWGDRLQTFYERYPWLKKVRYDGRKSK